MNSKFNLKHFTSCLLLSCCAIVSAVANAALDKEELQRELSGPDRDVSDFMRDASRKPVEVLEFAGIDESMAVLDM